MEIKKVLQRALLEEKVKDSFYVLSWLKQINRAVNNAGKQRK